MSQHTPSVRLAAVRVVHTVLSQRASLASALPQWSDKLPAEDRALLMELSYGCTRWSFRLSALMALLMDKPLRNKDGDVATLIQLGLYQLACMRIPDHAVINTTVAVTAELRKSWAKGLVNAVLRNYLRRKAALESALSCYAAQAFPQWLGERLHGDWSQDADAMLAMANARPPMILRVNLSQQSREDYLARLAGAGIAATAARCSDSAVVLDEPLAVDRLPGFEHGQVSVQDTAAQLAAPLLEPRDGERILDACAAPGGKTCHLLELAPAARVVAVDSVASRLQRVDENAARLGVSARLECICAEAQHPERWWDGRQFDAILLDAPCSGSGVLRRHPDIKLLRRADDMAALVALQRSLLQALWTVLKPGGRLLYATCSVLKSENEEQIAQFVSTQADATVIALDGQSWGRERGFGRQLLGDTLEADGFFYSLLARAG